MIEIKNISRSFGDLLAVNGISLSISKGDVVGFLGPNGAGKSTTMRLLTGFLSSDSGKISICGYGISKNREIAQSFIGYLPEAAGGFSNLTVYEFLVYCCGARRIKGSNRRAAIASVARDVDIGAVLYKKMYSLSKGWRQRVWLAQALVHNPPILILDEPTDGLDPNQKDQIRKLIRSFADDKAIILSTHILEEAEEVCNRAVIINNGEIIVDRPTEDLFDKYGRLTQTFREATTSINVMGQLKSHA